MKRLLFVLIILLAFGAGKGFTQTVDSTTLNAASITGTVTLNSSTEYIIKGFNVIQSGGALVIPAGTILKGDKATTGTIIVQRGGILYANGSQNSPIVFTSRFAPGQRGPGDWGGIVVLGRSSINTSTGADSAKIEGFPSGTDFYYGGQPVVNDDSSGCLRYVRLEYPGVNLTGVSGNEINGLTMGGVGSRTVLEYIQVTHSGDDAFEWFGGNVNPKYLIALGSIDDDFDCDNGWRGKCQFGLAIRDTNFVDVSNSHFFEIDNNNNNPSNFNSPRTQPVFSNITCIGPNSTNNPLFARGLHIRRNSLPSIFNSVMGGYGKLFYFDGSGVYNACDGDTIRLRNLAMSYINKLSDTAGGSFNSQDWLLTPSFNNTVNNPISAFMLKNPFAFYGATGSGTLSGVDWWEPMTGSPVLTGASFSDPYLNGFEVTSYRGAFDNVTDGAGNWTSGWSNFNPQNYEPVGVLQISSNVPERFTLSQNYPNPFNPSTKINFSVPVKGFVSLKIYDALGQEVATLLNQDLSVGEYAYEFDGTQLSSGIYFYTLRGDNFVETKKMMLVK